jgi:hypothetical protein
MIVNIPTEICWKCGKRKYERVDLREGHYVIKPTILISVCIKCYQYFNGEEIES